ncbi:MAG: flagellar hook capping FlgD N-terminal domain-containing protein [Planctomycetaceae bacterium]|jgi:flagellar basal-body rod modification protein FlgD
MNEASITAAVGQQQFLQLLVTQLQHQNPLDPLKQEDFLAQLAQFSSLEGIERLNARFSDLLALQELTQGADLIGKGVSFTSPSGELQSGIVSATQVNGDRLQLIVNGTPVLLEQVQSVVGTAA